ncbi:MAG: zinc ribbon domain-containing protein, partial [Gemmatimonadaceae bacterium]
MTACSFCGAANDPASRFCIDCGKPMSAEAARPAAAMMAAATVSDSESLATAGTTPLPSSGFYAVEKTCPRCAKGVDPTLPFCGHCGSKVSGTNRANHCGECGAEYIQGVDVFCARCGNRVGQRVSINMRMTPELTVNIDRASGGPRL